MSKGQEGTKLTGNFIFNKNIVKPPTHRAALPGKVISFYIVLLDPDDMTRLAAHVPVSDDHRGKRIRKEITWEMFIAY